MDGMGDLLGVCGFLMICGTLWDCFECAFAGTFRLWAGCGFVLASKCAFALLFQNTSRVTRHYESWPGIVGNISLYVAIFLLVSRKSHHQWNIQNAGIGIRF